MEIIINTCSFKTYFLIFLSSGRNVIFFFHLRTLKSSNTLVDKKFVKINYLNF